MLNNLYRICLVNSDKEVFYSAPNQSAVINKLTRLGFQIASIGLVEQNIYRIAQKQFQAGDLEWAFN